MADGLDCCLCFNVVTAKAAFGYSYLAGSQMTYSHQVDRREDEQQRRLARAKMSFEMKDINMNNLVLRKMQQLWHLCV